MELSALRANPGSERSHASGGRGEPAMRGGGVSRVGYYRFLHRGEAEETDMDLRSAIQAIAVEWPAYGYRRVHAELRGSGW